MRSPTIAAVRRVFRLTIEIVRILIRKPYGSDTARLYRESNDSGRRAFGRSAEFVNRKSEMTRMVFLPFFIFSGHEDERKLSSSRPVALFDKLQNGSTGPAKTDMISTPSSVETRVRPRRKKRTNKKNHPNKGPV